MRAEHKRNDAELETKMDCLRSHLEASFEKAPVAGAQSSASSPKQNAQPDAPAEPKAPAQQPIQATKAANMKGQLVQSRIRQKNRYLQRSLHDLRTEMLKPSIASQKSQETSSLSPPMNSQTHRLAMLAMKAKPICAGMGE